VRNEKNQQNKEARLEVQAMFLRNVAQSAIFTALQLTGPHGSLSLSTLRGQDSSVTTGTRLRPGQPGFDSSRDRRLFPFLTASSPTLRSTDPHIQSVK
jgi:hypothetical protein